MPLPTAFDTSRQAAVKAPTLETFTAADGSSLIEFQPLSSLSDQRWVMTFFLMRKFSQVRNACFGPQSERSASANALGGGL